MNDNLHTEIDLRITPLGGDPYIQTHLFENIELNAEEADDYISWGNERNDIIKDAVYWSPYASLDNYEVIRCDVFTLVELEERKNTRAKKIKKIRKPRKTKEPEIKTIVVDECTNIQSVEEIVELTEEEKVSIASANGIRWALDNSERLAQRVQVSLEEQWKDLGCNGWLKPSGEFIEVEWHVLYARDYVDDDPHLDEKYHEFIMDKNHWNKCIYDFMEELGWVRVQGDRSKNKHYVENAYFRKINHIQMKKLTLICMKYKADFKKVIESSEWRWKQKRNIT